MREVWIRGAAMTKFGRHLDRTARDLVEEAVARALADAEVGPDGVGAVYVGNAAAGIMSGQECVRAQVVLRHTGLMGVPIVNVENACASSSSALHLGWQAVAGGIHDCVVVVGYEKLVDEDRSKSIRAINAAMDLTELADIFGADPGRERNVFMDLHGATSTGEGRDRFDREVLALVSVKNHHHGSLNPHAHHGVEVTVEQVLASRPVAGPLTVLMCSPFSDGAACLVLAARGLRRGDPDVRIAASALTSGRGDDLRQPNATRRAARQAYERAGIGPDDLDLVELHDASAVTELYLYEELSLCPRGESVRLVRDRVTWLGGRLPVNTSGGLISRGDPIGATGVAQVVELTWQLRGRCGPRQVPTPRTALAQSGGGWIGTDVAACAIHILQR